jgi:hypothetical protein
MDDASYRETWRTYQAAWEDVSSSERRRLLGQTVSPACVYSDPLVECRGIDSLAARIEQARTEAPGISFRNDTFEQHHQQCVAVWRRLTPAGAVDFVGTSYGRFGDDGRLVQITGFPRPVE